MSEIRKCSVCRKIIKTNNHCIIEGNVCCVCGEWFCNDCLDDITSYYIQNCNYADRQNKVYLCHKCYDKNHTKFERMEKITDKINKQFDKLKGLVDVVKYYAED